MADVKTVRFLRDEEVKDHNGVVVQSFRAGEVVELSIASARRWLRRLAAEEVTGEAPMKEPDAPLSDAGGDGSSPAAGPGEPSSASPQAPVSPSSSSPSSDEPATETSAASLPSTAATSEPAGPMSATGRTRRGGGRRQTPPGSEG